LLGEQEIRPSQSDYRRPDLYLNLVSFFGVQDPVRLREKLIERIHARDVIDLEDQAGVTSFQAKFIAFEFVRDALRKNPASINGFYDRLSLKVTIPGDSEARELGTSIHDGYFMASRLEWGSDGPDRARQLAVDCTSVVHACLTRENLSRLELTRFISNQLYQMKIGDSAPDFPFYEVGPSSDFDLKPGDLLVTPGHVYVFQNFFRGSEGGFRMRTIEAVGGRFRRFGNLVRNLVQKNERCSVSVMNGSNPVGCVKTFRWSSK
jgi:hypothetical protein